MVNGIYGLSRDRREVAEEEEEEGYGEGGALEDGGGV